MLLGGGRRAGAVHRRRDDAGRETDQISVFVVFFFSLAIMVNLYERQKCHWIDHSHS